MACILGKEEPRFEQGKGEEDSSSTVRHLRRGKGRKERMKAKLEKMKKEKEEHERQAKLLSKQNMALKRSLLNKTRKRQLSSILSSPLASSTFHTRGSVTRPSVPTNDVSTHVSLKDVRLFHEKDVALVKTKCLGKGAFGKCYFGCVGPQDICVKVIRKGLPYQTSFKNEAYILSLCCHRNIVFLFGIMVKAGYSCLLVGFHGIEGKSHSIHSLLYSKDLSVFVSSLLTTKNFTRILSGIAKGLAYLHNHTKGPVLHNDLKTDNVVIDVKSGNILVPHIIDFGKACCEKNAKMYDLSVSEKEYYTKYHPQVAPDVRDGLQKQSKMSDIYLFGRVIATVNKEKLLIPLLSSFSELCLNYDSKERPKTNDVCTFLDNML